MKLRLRGDSLRLRLTQSEVAAVGAGGEVRERTPFGSGQALEYRLRADAAATEVAADFRDNRISVTLPAELAAGWANGAEVTIAAGQAVAGADTLRILVEKDFACLSERPGEDDSDAFPHPDAG
mgnify:CR=1 FL=1